MFSKLTIEQRLFAFLCVAFLLFTALIVMSRIRSMQLLMAQARAFNALAEAIESGEPVSIPITVNIAKFNPDGINEKP